MFEILGVAGIAISMLAYQPQVVHLAKEHCSAGVSSRAWAMWLVSSVLIGALAVHRHDPVFVLLQVSSLASAAAILILGHRYRGLICEAHLNSIPKRWLGTDLTGRSRPADDTDPRRAEGVDRRVRELDVSHSSSGRSAWCSAGEERTETVRVDDPHLASASLDEA